MALGRPWRRGTLRGRRGTISHARSFCVAGVAQTHIYHRFAWQAWHWWHWVARLVLVWSPVTPRHFAWQAWHILTSTFVLRGRRSTNSHLPSFCVGLVARDVAALCVAGVAQSHIHVRFAWQAWHKLTSTIVLRGRRGTDGTGWRAWSWFGRPWRRGTLRGRRGTFSHPRLFCVAGMAQTHIYHRFALVWSPVTPRHFAWQARHNLTCTFVLRGRRGTNSHLPSFCVAGVALMALGGALGLGLVARDAVALCVAGVAQSHIHVRFPWQAWHKLTSTIVLRGRCGTISHPPSFCVAGVAFMALCRSSAWDGLVVSRGRRGAISQLTHHLSQNFVAYHLSHTQLCHAPSFPHNSVTHNFVTHNSTTTTATTSQSS